MFGNKFISRLVVSTVVLMCCACVAIGFTIYRLRDDAIEEAKQRANDVATVLAQRANDGAHAVDVLLEEVQARIASYDPRSKEEFARLMVRRDMHDFLAARLAKLSSIDAINVNGSDGRLLSSTRDFPAPDVDLSDREEFLHFAELRDPGMFIGAPDFSRISGKWSMHFARRIETPAGEFLGIVMIPAQPSIFMQLQKAIADSPGMSSLFLRQDGVVYLRYPDAVERAGNRMPKESGFYRVVAEGGGYFHSPGVFDTESRWVATRLLADYPMAVNVAISENVALTVWRKRSLVIALGSALTTVVMGMLLASIFVGYRKTLAAGALLASREESLAVKSRELKVANFRFEAALAHMRQGLAMFDRDNRLVIRNRGYAELYGLEPGFMEPGTTLGEILAMRAANGILAPAGPEQRILLQGRHEDESSSEVQQLRDGRFILVAHQNMPDGGWVTTHEDVTERQRAVAQISHIAHHDSLTDLANRTLFLQRIDALGARAASYAIMLLDLDHFKQVNDTHGHSAGDELLWSAASRMQEVVGSRGLVARLGGDEFAIVVELAAPNDNGDIAKIADRLLKRIGEPHQALQHEALVSASIGVAFAMGAEASPRDTMRHADLALYQAKAAGRDCCRVFEPSMEANVVAGRQLAVDLGAALARRQLEVYYQPVVDAITLEARCMEALARWRHPTRGFVPPLEFIGVAEEAGHIEELGEFVLTRACADAMGWPEHVKVAVNVSPSQLESGEFIDTVRRCLAASGLPAERLELEITESVLLNRNEHNLEQLHALRELGVAIVLDDFGTGYSSLSYLNNFHFDKIKIDKAFIDGLGVRAESSAIVMATISIARSLNAITTAEGVESEEQQTLLRAASVTQVQGYLHGKPRPAAEWEFVNGRAVPARDRKDAVAAA